MKNLLGKPIPTPEAIVKIHTKNVRVGSQVALGLPELRRGHDGNHCKLDVSHAETESLNEEP